MKRFKLSLIIIALVTMMWFFAGPLPAPAATTNPSPGSTGYESLVLHMPGAYSSTVTPIKFKSPWPYRVVSISAYARSLNNVGTGTYTVDIQQGGTSLLSTPISIASTASNTIVDGVLATTPTIADEATVSAVLTLGGTSPSMTDVTVILGVKRQ